MEHHLKNCIPYHHQHYTAHHLQIKLRITLKELRKKGEPGYRGYPGNHTPNPQSETSKRFAETLVHFSICASCLSHMSGVSALRRGHASMDLAMSSLHRGHASMVLTKGLSTLLDLCGSAVQTQHFLPSARSRPQVRYLLVKVPWLTWAWPQSQTAVLVKAIRRTSMCASALWLFRRRQASRT